jgi:hypothetical protein
MSVSESLLSRVSLSRRLKICLSEDKPFRGSYIIRKRYTPLWKEAVFLLAGSRNKNLSLRSREELERLQEIRSEMKKYKAKGPSYKWKIDRQIL